MKTNKQDVKYTKYVFKRIYSIIYSQHERRCGSMKRINIKLQYV